MTPKQKLLDLGIYQANKILDLGIYQANKILDFKVLYLDSYFYQLQKYLEYFYFQRDLKSTTLKKLKIDRKTSIDLVTKYNHLKLYAQNILTYYQIDNNFIFTFY